MATMNSMAIGMTISMTISMSIGMPLNPMSLETIT